MGRQACRSVNGGPRRKGLSVYSCRRVGGEGALHHPEAGLRASRQHHTHLIRVLHTGPGSHHPHCAPSTGPVCFGVPSPRLFPPLPSDPGFPTPYKHPRWPCLPFEPPPAPLPPHCPGCSPGMAQTFRPLSRQPGAPCSPTTSPKPAASPTGGRFKALRGHPALSGKLSLHTPSLGGHADSVPLNLSSPVSSVPRGPHPHLLLLLPRCSSRCHQPWLLEPVTRPCIWLRVCNSASLLPHPPPPTYRGVWGRLLLPRPQPHPAQWTGPGPGCHGSSRCCAGVAERPHGLTPCFGPPGAPAAQVPSRPWSPTTPHNATPAATSPPGSGPWEGLPSTSHASPFGDLP